MPYFRACLNPACNKPFRTYNPVVKCCSRACDTAIHPPATLATRFWAKVQQCAHGDFCPFCCWEWVATRLPSGHGQIGIKKGDKWVTCLAPTTAWELINKRSLPKGLQINHHCDNPPCVSIWHIYAGSQSQNMVDAYRRGRQLAGEGRSKLKTAEVVSMREAYRQGVLLVDLAEKYGIGQSAVFQILIGRSWKHLPGALSPEEIHAIVLPRRQLLSRTRPSTFLTEDKVLLIRDLYRQGIGPTALARQFGASRTHIKAIIRGKSWKHLL